MGKKVSVLIPSFRRADLLVYGLRSLTSQKLDREAEVIVLNDGLAEDATQSICETFGVKYIFTGHRNYPETKWRCPGVAINIGVKQATGDVILLTVPEIYTCSPDVLSGLCS